MKIIEPVVGNWYRNLNNEQDFEVVAVEADQGLIEIQYFDGDIEELDTDSWYEMDIDYISSPEDWSGPFESKHKAFQLEDEIAARPTHWTSLLENF